MPTTPVLALPYPAPGDPADVPTDMGELALAVETAIGPATSTTPPASPVTGQLWYLPVAAGVVWQFRYNAGAAGSFKWEFVGGPALAHEIPTLETTTVITYSDTATPGPQVTVPRAGDYDAIFGCAALHSVASQAMRATVKLGAAAAGDAESVMQTTSAAVSTEMTMQRWVRLLNRAAGEVLKMQYNSNPNGTTASWRRRYLSVTPVRIS